MISIYEYRPLLFYCTAVAAAFGAVMGSFLNCAAWRYVRGESFLRGRSRCPSCGHVLGASELIPVFSWLFQRGRCRACGSRIPVRYPLTELCAALITVLCLLRFDLTVLCLRNYVFLCCLFFLTLTDLEEMVIPDECHVISVTVWVLTLSFTGETLRDGCLKILSGILAGGLLLAVSLILDRVLGRESLGGGDIKLLAVTGLYLGPVGTLFALMISCALGLLLRGAVSEKGKEFPFGPFLAAGAGAMLLFGDPLVRWYTGLLGM